MKNFVLFHAIETELELAEEFGEKRNSMAPYRAIGTQTLSV